MDVHDAYKVSGMGAYYRKPAEGMGRGEAMQAVQFEMLRSEEHAHPKDWAAFIVSGDDTPMVFPEGEEPRVEEETPPETEGGGGCATRRSGRGAPPGSMLVGLLGGASEAEKAMMERVKSCGRLGLVLAALVWVAPVSGWARAPKKKVPNETRLQEAAELKVEYMRLYGERKYGKAKPLMERACSILEEERGKESVEAAECFVDLGVLLRVQGAREKAEALLVRGLAIYEKVYGPDHLVIARLVSHLAILYEDQGAYGKAEPLFERALAILEKALGPDHLDVASSLENLAALHRIHGSYGRAEPLLGRALAIREKALGADHLDVAWTLSSLAALYKAQGAHEKASSLFERALAIWEQATPKEFPNLKREWTRLLEGGRFREAALLGERTCSMLKQAHGENSLMFAGCLNLLGNSYIKQGEYDKSESVYKQALETRRKLLPSDNIDVAVSLGHLGRLYRVKGEYGKAEPLLKESLALHERSAGSDNMYVARSLGNLAALYSDQGAYENAEPLYERALTIVDGRPNPYLPDVATGCSNLALVYQNRGAYKQAEPLYERALAIREKALGPDHPDVALALHNLATLHQAQGLYKEAEPLYERALAIREKALGPDHLFVAQVLGSLASMYDDRGHHDLALELLRRAFEIQESNLARTMTVAEEERRLAYASTLSGSLQYVLSLHLRVIPEHDAIAELALTTLLRHKNRVQDLIARSNAALRRSLPEDNQHLLDDLTDVDSQISVLSSGEPDAPGSESHARQIDELRQQRDRLWSELAKHSALVEALDHPVAIEDVQRALPNGGALVELAQYVPHHDDAGTHLCTHDLEPPARYAAYILFPTHFTWVDLGPAAPIDEHIKAFRTALQTKQAIPTDLYDAVMRPIVEKLGSAHHLIIAPAGDLSLIPFGALYDGERYLVEKYELRYVTTGRDLLAPPASPPVTTTPVTIVANPTGANLPDAELEADFLASLFPKTRIMRGDQATETNVRAIERPLVLHMATHGFFGDALNDRDNPLFRSGLRLADPTRVEVDRERDDGQLTAYEVSRMDLRGTQLVVLSACETGLGTAVKAEGKELMSEGIAGLRRAFAMAGARTMVMSLWEVSGVTTQKTMEAYHRKLAEGMGRGEAMQAVQLEMLRSEEHAHPKDWAVFIVSGDDTPMMFPEGEGPRVEEEKPPETEARGGCATKPSGRGAPTGSMLIGLLGLAGLRRRRRGQ